MTSCKIPRRRIGWSGLDGSLVSILDGSLVSILDAVSIVAERIVGGGDPRP
jgi:hypothetical protein